MSKVTSLHLHRNSHPIFLIVLAVGALILGWAIATALSLIFFVQATLPHFTAIPGSHVPQLRTSTSQTADYQAIADRYRDPQMLYFFGT